MADNRSIIERIIHERQAVMKTMPDKIRDLEKRLETGKMTPAEVRTAHELLASMKKQLPKK